MFTLNEKVVYPGHGVAKINRVIKRKIAGKVSQFFELSFLSKDMTILVPINNLTAVGIRKLSTNDTILEVFRLLAEPIEPNNDDAIISNWNKRNKEYQCKLRSGNIRELSLIYRDLKTIASGKELSFSEKNLLHQTESLLAEEIALVSSLSEKEAIERLRLPFEASKTLPEPHHSETMPGA